MHKLRFILVGVGAVALPLTLAATASAQFDSPAPLAWRFLQPTKVPPGGAPVPNSNLVYQSIGGRVYCAYKDTGNLVWRYPQLDPIDGAFRTSPILAGGSLLATGDNSILYSIDPETGAAKWSQRIPAPSIGHPVVVGDAYVTAMSDNSLIALKVSDGTPLWSAPAGSTPGSSDASVYKVYDGIVGRVAASGDDVLYFTGKQTLVALNVARRAVDWQQSFDQLPPSPQVTVTREAIYLNSGPYLIALNPAKGTARWQVDTGMQLIETPVVSETGIMVLSQDGHAQVYDQLSHRPVMRNAKGEIAAIELGSTPLVRPTAAGNDFVVLTANGAINLIDPTKSAAQWVYIIKPLVETVTSSGGRGMGGQKGGGPGVGGPGAGGPPGFGGGGGGGGQGPGGPGGFGGNQGQPTKITYIQAAAPAIVDGQTLIVPARDGSILAFDKTLGVDLTAPTIDMQFPNPGDQVSGQPPLFLLFKLVDDDSGLKRDSIKVEINGQPLDFTLDSEDRVIVRFSLSGKNRPLADGRKEIVVTASDWMGNVGHKTFYLTIDNALRPIVVPGSEKTGPGGKGPGFGGGGGPGGLGGGQGDGG
jgi:outer membrane protein assembly factor BamB